MTRIKIVKEKPEPSGYKSDQVILDVEIPDEELVHYMDLIIGKLKEALEFGKTP